VIHQLLESSQSSSSTSQKTSTGIAASKDSDSPYALKAIYYNSWTKTKSIVDNNWKPHAHDLDLVDSSQYDAGQAQAQAAQVYVRMKRSACHWYFFQYMPNQPMGERLCGHKIWMNDSLQLKNPALDQELQIAAWFKKINTKINTKEKPISNANEISLSLTAHRGMLDNIDAPFAANFHKCTSLEYGRFPWTFRENGEDNAKSESEPPTCGTMGSGKLSLFHRKLQQTVLDPIIRQLANEEMCSDMVTFGEALSETNLAQLLSMLDGDGGSKSKEKIRQFNHGRCFFLFVVKEDLPSKWMVANSNIAAAGHHWLIPVDKKLLPYESPKRNSKLFQYNGQFFFPHAKSVVYDNTSLFSQPMNYSELFPRPNNNKDRGQELEPCLTVYALPRNSETLGNNFFQQDEAFFQGQCKNAINTMGEEKKKEQPGNIISLIQQCDAYLQFVYKRELDTEFLDQGMADTSFMIWNENTEFCRDANAQLRCTILDQMHCHSEHDRTIFPFALYVNQMGFGSTTEYTASGESGRWKVDAEYDQRFDDLNFFRPIQGNPGYQDVVRILGSLHK
jgi:hypothetical protein